MTAPEPDEKSATDETPKPSAPVPSSPSAPDGEAGDDEDGGDDDDEDDEDEIDEAEVAQAELEETVELATERLAQTPDDVGALLIRGEALDDLGEATRARKDLERAVTLAPTSAAAQLAWARWLYGQDDEARALEACEHAIERGGPKATLDPIDQQTGWNDTWRARAHYLKGAILARREALEDALTELDLSLGFDPEEPSALLRRGEVRHALGDLEGALDDLSRAVAGDPEDSEARLARAEALLEAGEIAAAYSEVEAAIDLAGDDPPPEMLVVRGEVRLSQGRVDEARADFRRAAEKDPEAVEPRLGLVDAALAANDLDAAEAAAKEALERGSDHPQALVFKARVDLARGRAEDAEKACTKAIELDSGAADAFALRSEARRALGKLEAAKHDAATARSFGFEVEEPS